MLFTKGYYNWLHKQKYYVVVIMCLVQIHTECLPKVKELQIQDFVQFPFPLLFLPSSPSGVVCKYLLLNERKQMDNNGRLKTFLKELYGEWWVSSESCSQKQNRMCSSVVEPHCVTIGLHFLLLYLSRYRWRYLQSQRRGIWNVGGSWSARRWRYSCGSSTGPGSDQALNKWLCFLYFRITDRVLFLFPQFLSSVSIILWG